MRDALARCGQVLPAIANLQEELSVLVDARNGVVHLGEVGGVSANASIVPFLKASHHFIGESGWDPGDFWGDFYEMVETRLSESVEEATVRTREVITAARLRFQQRYSALPEEVLKGIREAIESGYGVTTYEEQVIDCPACESPALAVGTVDVSWEADWESDEFGEPYIGGAYPLATFYPGHVDCKACELELDGEDEIRAAGLDESWELEDIDPSYFYDEDYDYES